MICLVQKNADSETAPPMAAQMGYTCARRDGRGTVRAGERGRGRPVGVSRIRAEQETI